MPEYIIRRTRKEFHVDAKQSHFVFSVISGIIQNVVINTLFYVLWSRNNWMNIYTYTYIVCFLKNYVPYLIWKF